MRAAVGWLGAIWLAPLAGAGLYSAFGVNRISRRAQRLVREAEAEADGAHGAHETPLARVGRVVGRSPLVDGNSVEAMANGTESYPRMLEAIRRARTSVALTSYIFRSDTVGHAFTDALLDAQARGVEVRVLLDSLGSGFGSLVARRLRAAGVPVVRFTRDIRPWRMSLLNLRNHKKVLVIDGRIGFVGGLNFSQDNDGHSPRVRDVHFRIEGPVVRQLVESLDSDLRLATGRGLEGDGWWPPLAPRGTVAARGVSSGPDGTVGAIENLLSAAVCEARERVRIVTPYYLPDRPLSALLRLAVLRGVRVEIVVPRESDHRFFGWALAAQMRFAARDGLHFHLSEPPFDHAKLVSVDGRWSAFGSPNWDVRSLRLNFEFLVECHSAAVAETVDAIIDRRIAAARPVRASDLRATRPVRLRDAAARLFLPYL